MTLENSAGRKEATVTVRSLDTPSEPNKIAIKDVEEDTVQIAWPQSLSGHKGWSSVPVSLDVN